MTSSGNVRSAIYNSQHAPTTSHAEPRAPPSRAGAQELPDSDDIYPQDSASVAPHQRTTSGTHRINGSTRTTSERRTERTHISIRDSRRSHVQRPAKDSLGGSLETPDPEISRPLRASSHVTEKQSTVRNGKKKKALRE